MVFDTFYWFFNNILLNLKKGSKKKLPNKGNSIRHDLKSIKATFETILLNMVNRHVYILYKIK